MSSVRAKALHVEQRFRAWAFVSEVRYDTTQLVVKVIAPKAGLAATVRFTEVIGFRVLDEGDLLEFWPQCSMGNGWLYRVDQGGWFDQEIARRGFLHEKVPGLLEYLVVSENDCVSVLAGDEPAVDLVSL